MNTIHATSVSPIQPRVGSVDLVRGLTILVMIFVNDVAGVHGAPPWMKHIEPSTADGMTFVDVVFPAFLFIVGLSLPVALERRMSEVGRGVRLWAHILWRTLGLLIIGVLMVNTESMSEHGPISGNLWMFLMYLGAILAWLAPSRAGKGSRRPRWLKLLGAALLVALVFLYRSSESSQGLIQLRPHWWGILGLIGWAYLVACAAYLALGRQPAALAGCVGVLYCAYFADHMGFFEPVAVIGRWVSIGSMLGSGAAITLSGAIVGQMLLPRAPTQSHGERVFWGTIFGALMAAAAVLLHSLRDLNLMFIYNKNAATPPWCLLSSAYSAWAWVGAYLLVDAAGSRMGTETLRRAGQNALLAYLLAPLFYSLLAWLAEFWSGAGFYWRLGESFETGLARSVVLSVAVIWVSAALHKAGIRLQL
jgi:predicted acyltransferase